MIKVSYMTREGYERLREELNHLTGVERPGISAQIAEARDKGDLSENAEYDAAKEAQGMLEMKIAKLEEAFAGARVIDETKIKTDTVQILNRVTIKNLSSNKVMEFILVSENEASLKDKKLSIETPIARALLGDKKGAIVTAHIPTGEVMFEIMDISI